MPYISSGLRPANNPLMSPTKGSGFKSMDFVRPIAIDDVGELNFAITILINEYVKRRPLKYAVLNDVVGVLASAMAEFQRRVVAPYEDRKLVENGDVYDCTTDLLLPKETDDAEPDKQA